MGCLLSQVRYPHCEPAWHIRTARGVTSSGPPPPLPLSIHDRIVQRGLAAIEAVKGAESDRGGPSLTAIVSPFLPQVISWEATPTQSPTRMGRGRGRGSRTPGLRVPGSPKGSITRSRTAATEEPEDPAVPGPSAEKAQQAEEDLHPATITDRPSMPPATGGAPTPLSNLVLTADPSRPGMTQSVAGLTLQPRLSLRSCGSARWHTEIKSRRVAPGTECETDRKEDHGWEEREGVGYGGVESAAADHFHWICHWLDGYADSDGFTPQCTHAARNHFDRTKVAI